MKQRMPALFVSHGAPNVLLLDDEYTRSVAHASRGFAKPDGAIVVSAHWVNEGDQVQVASTPKPDTIHDFGGFQRELYQLRYPCKGAPELAATAFELLKAHDLPVALNDFHGLDHGAWVPMKLLYPDADVPTLQISLPQDTATPRFLYEVGRALAPLRNEGILLLGSGGLVHNLGELVWHGKSAEAPDWARTFHNWMKGRIEENELEELFEFEVEAPFARRAHPSAEHILPLFFSLGARLDGDRFETIFDSFHYQTLSMYTFMYRS